MTVLHPLPWMFTSGMVLLLVLKEVFPDTVAVAGAVVGALVVGVLVGRQWAQQPAGMM